MKFAPIRTRLLSAAFSLVEVVLALGIVAFALVSVIGLLPAGLNSQRQATEQARAIQALSAVSNSIRGVHANGTTTSAEFLPPLGGTPATGVTDPVAVGPGDDVRFLMEDGSLNTASSNARSVIHIDQLAPIGPTSRISPVFLSVAWPPTAQWQGGKWKNAEGSVSAMVYFTSPLP